MYDADWNPASDLQALAHIWRIGQTKKCCVLRLCTTGTMEEHIFQRQIGKTGLSNAVLQGLDRGEEDHILPPSSKCRRVGLEDIVALDRCTVCGIHEALGCQRCGATSKGFVPQASWATSECMAGWSHHADVNTVTEPVLAKAASTMKVEGSQSQGSHVGFVMSFHSQMQHERSQQGAEEKRRHENGSNKQQRKARKGSAGTRRRK